MQRPHRVKLIACDILARESHHAAARSRRTVDVELVQQGLHGLGAEGMSAELQRLIDVASAKGDAEGSMGYDEILMGYGLCNNGVVGLKAGSVPIVIPKVHDCISVFLGSAERYRMEFDESPGTYYFTAGWLEHDLDLEHPPGTTVNERLGIGKSREQYAAEYGEENADYIMETLSEGLTHYTRVAFISMGLGPEDDFERLARERADADSLAFEKLDGSLAMIERLCDGDNSKNEFLVVPPGGAIEPDVAGSILRCSSCSGE